MFIENNPKLFKKWKPSVFGYAYHGAIDYNIEDAKIPPFKLKEWNFYQITNNKFSFYAIIGHVSYATSINCTLFELETGKTIYVGKLVPFKKVKMDKNASSDSVVIYQDKDYKMEFRKVGKTRYIKMDTIHKEYEKCSVDIRLEDTVNDNILVCTPFDKPKHFYLNQKTCLLKASGEATFGNNQYNFDNSFGLMDWGRGYLPFKHSWIWGSGSGYVDGIKFGFNIGSFGNNENGSENIFFYDDTSYKMDKVDISFNENNPMEEWHYRSSDDNFVFTMKPIYDNHTKTKILWVNNECHQVFGLFNGYIIVDNKKIEIKDFLAFTENAHNRW